MGISELRQLGAHHLEAADALDEKGRELVQAGTISRGDAALAQMVARHCDASLDRILFTEGIAAEREILAARAKLHGNRVLGRAELAALATPAPPGTDPRQLLKWRAAPLVTRHGNRRLALSDPARARDLRDQLPASLRDLPHVLAPDHAIQDAVANANRDVLTDLAQARVDASESCRTWSATPHRRLALTLCALTVCLVLTALYPAAVFSVFVGWAALTLVVAACFKTAAFAARMTVGNPVDHAPIASGPEKLPKVSVLVPLYRETEIAHALITRLSRLTYPKCLLDVVLVLEEEDTLTQKTLAEIDLPAWMRAVIVPDGHPRTKPRAMNYALDFCEGDIIGIFDAEDAPDPDQITMVARRFQAAPPDVACLQGILDYYNPRQNWLARSFTIEYATWFRLILPGLAKLGLAIPLGGTTLFFRRDALEELGGWDAHNVTEDADLGFRLARHGYRTEIIGTVTGEEANCRLWPWVKQRSRWLKGYMTTYLVHMRSPRLLRRQLGAWRFWGFQAHFVTTVSQVLLAPFLWSFWLVLLGLPHPLDPVLSREVLMAVGKLFLAVEMINIAIHAVAVSGRFHRHLLPWVPLMHFYAPLGTIAAYKALYEMIFAPFFWDKTTHGLSLKSTGTDADATASKGAVDLARIQLEARHKRF
ncbi:glycosyltransferase [Roseovarius sp. SCSIO 43702]|uniref:glycosyltransferase n=1 Tax=Roseovarius sp. SCSIO 43702 TaxID=2823043 RepID=UPI001C72D52B|nr:glycosyltransferase [Roseovarius sp. SCSIO 43702]QYX57618.1 glycosyltransferase [Roseovarius sp. SCSIO 43702]